MNNAKHTHSFPRLRRGKVGMGACDYLRPSTAAPTPTLPRATRGGGSANGLRQHECADAPM
jgi:hypothetical protein